MNSNTLPLSTNSRQQQQERDIERIGISLAGDDA
jgi:hypothetical protein